MIINGAAPDRQSNINSGDLYCMHSFKLDGRCFFLTYPKCDIPRGDCLELIKQKLLANNPTHWCVAQEQHEDGTNHLHVMVIVEHKKSIRSANFFDLGAHHGNYQTVRNREKVFDYICKSDSNVLTNITVDDLKKKGVTRIEIGKRILAGEEPKDLVEEYPQLIFGFKRLQEDIRAVEEAKMEYPDLPSFLPNSWGFLISTSSKAKRRHWWIFSSCPNRGKTTFARDLQTRFRAYVKASDFSYWNVTGKESLIILDDYNTAGLRFNSLNQLCDGSFEARVFMAGVKRLEPKLVIVLSNVRIRDLYPNMYHLLEARFIEKELV